MAREKAEVPSAGVGLRRLNCAWEVGRSPCIYGRSRIGEVSIESCFAELHCLPTEGPAAPLKFSAPTQPTSNPDSPVKSMSEFITFKRWSLREGREEPELVKLVREEIIPHYEKIPGCLRLGLLNIVGTRSYLALQHWKNHDALRAAYQSNDNRAWYKAYKPMLERWNELMIFEEEWESEDVLGIGGGV